jgi:hypothetical protein
MATRKYPCRAFPRRPSDYDLAGSTGRDAVQREEYVDLDEEVELGKKSQCEKEQYVLLIISNC